MTVLELLARPKSGEGVKSGPIGLAVILLLCIAAYFLFKSMSKHLRRVRENFPDGGPTTGSARQAAPAAPAAASAEERSAQQAAQPPLPPSAPPPPPPAGTDQPG